MVVFGMPVLRLLLLYKVQDSVLYNACCAMGDVMDWPCLKNLTSEGAAL